MLINFDINPDLQARALLGLLRENEERFKHFRGLSINTYYMVNGREHGYCLDCQMIAGSWEHILIFFAEVRNSDGLFVQTQRVSGPLKNNHQPTLDDFSEASYYNRRVFGHFKIYEALEEIFNQIQNWHKF